MSCPFCKQQKFPEVITRSQNGQYVPYPYPQLQYAPPIVDATTEEILKLRSKIHTCDSEALHKAKGIYHWSNVPSGNTISKDFNKHFPTISGSKKQAPVASDFPYPCTAPHVPPPQPHLNFSTPAARPQYVPAGRAQNQQLSQCYRPAGSACQNSCSVGKNGGNIQQAIQHIDAATRILRNY